MPQTSFFSREEKEAKKSGDEVGAMLVRLKPVLWPVS
jgi:hypothetical protein